MPWQDLKDFRNVTTPQYWEIDVTIVWDVIENKIPELKHSKAETTLPHPLLHSVRLIACPEPRREA